MRLTAQVSEVSPAAAQIVSFLAVPADDLCRCRTYFGDLCWGAYFGHLDLALEIRPEVSPEAAKIVSFLSVPAAAFDIEDHRSTGQKTGS